MMGYRSVKEVKESLKLRLWEATPGANLSDYESLVMAVIKGKKPEEQETLLKALSRDKRAAEAIKSLKNKGQLKPKVRVKAGSQRVQQSSQGARTTNQQTRQQVARGPMTAQGRTPVSQSHQRRTWRPNAQTQPTAQAQTPQTQNVKGPQQKPDRAQQKLWKKRWSERSFFDRLTGGAFSAGREARRQWDSYGKPQQEQVKKAIDAYNVVAKENGLPKTSVGQFIRSLNGASEIKKAVGEILNNQNNAPNIIRKYIAKVQDINDQRFNQTKAAAQRFSNRVTGQNTK